MPHTSSEARAYLLEPAAAPASHSQVGYGLIAFELPFDIVCDRCSAQYARKDTFDTARRRIRSAEGHTQWSYTFTLPCCASSPAGASVEIRADAIYLTYVVVSGAHALDPKDEEAVFEELRNLTGRRAAADSALAASTSAHAMAGPSTHQGSAAAAPGPLPSFTSAPSASRLAALEATHYNFAPTASSPGNSAAFNGATSASSVGGSPRTLLGGLPGARHDHEARLRLPAELPEGTSRTALQLQALYERERRDRARGGPGMKGTGGIGYNLEAREGIGIGGTDGRGGGTSRYPAPAPPLKVARAVKAQQEAAAAANSRTLPRRRTSASSIAPSDSASVRTLKRSAASALPPRTRAAAVLARSQPAASLGASLARKARKREDAFEREMWDAVQKGRGLAGANKAQDFGEKRG